MAIFIRTPFNHGIIYDMGCSDEFSPAEFLHEQILPHLECYCGSKVAQVILSHPHADHIQEIDRIKADSPLYPSLLTCPHDKPGNPDEAIDWDRMQLSNATDGLLGNYRDLYAKRRLPLQTIRYEGSARVPNVAYGVYYVRPPKVAELFPNDDHAYGNGVSLALYYRHGSNSILIPGDINPESLSHLLAERAGAEKRFTAFDRDYVKSNPTHHSASSGPGLREVLQEHGLSVLVAPHHGLKSCYCGDIYNYIKGGKPGLVAISEKRHMGENDGEVDKRYQNEGGSHGNRVQIDGGKLEKKYSVSTRNGHHILVKFSGTSPPEVILEETAECLLQHLD